VTAGALVPIILILLDAPAPAHAEPSAHLDVRGDDQPTRHLTLELVIQDSSTGEVLARCVWDGHGPAKSEVTRRLDRVLTEFSVFLRVKYRGKYLAELPWWVHADEPGRPIVVEASALEFPLSVECAGANLPEVKVVRRVGREVVEVTVRPTVELTADRIELVIRGIVRTRDRFEHRSTEFTGRVAVTRPRAVALRSLGPLVKGFPLPSLTLAFYSDRMELCATAGASFDARTLVTVRTDGKEVRLDSEWKEAPSFATLTVPTGPVRLRVELYWRDRRVGAFEYLVRPGRVVVPLLGPRYVEVRIERVRAEAVENLRALEPVIEHPSDSDPVTLIHWYYLYYPEGGSGPITYEVTLRISPDLPIPPGSFPSSEEVANVLLGLSTACLVRALNDALGLPRSLVDGFLITPPRLPPEYALLGLAACLATLASRYYLGLLTYALTGAYVQEGVFGALPLGLWGLRLIAAGTGLPLPLVGALARFVQWVLDEAYSINEPWWGTLRRVLLNPVKYVGRCLRELIEEGPIGAACDLAWLAIQGTLITVPPPPLAYVLYLASDNGEGPDPITSAITYLLDAAITCLEYPALAPIYALELGGPILVFALSPPRWFLEALALPSLLSYLLELLVILPQHLLSTPTTEVRVSITVPRPIPSLASRLQYSLAQPH